MLLGGVEFCIFVRESAIPQALVSFNSITLDIFETVLSTHCLVFVFFRLFWQEQLDVFNSNNPAGYVTEDETYFKFLLACIFVGAVVSLKRLFLAIYLGRREVTHFSSELEMLMAKMILIGEVANLARNIENKRDLFAATPMYDHIGESGKLVRFQEFISTMHEEEGVMHEEGGVSATPPISVRKIREVQEVSPPNTEDTTPPKTAPGPQGESPHISPSRPMPERIPRSSSDATGDRTILPRDDSSPNIELCEYSSIIIMQFDVRSIPYSLTN